MRMPRAVRFGACQKRLEIQSEKLRQRPSKAGLTREPTVHCMLSIQKSADRLVRVVLFAKSKLPPQRVCQNDLTESILTAVRHGKKL